MFLPALQMFSLFNQTEANEPVENLFSMLFSAPRILVILLELELAAVVPQPDMAIG